MSSGKALAALALGAFGIGIAEMAVTGLLGRIADGYGTTAASLGTAISLYALGVAVGAPLITILGARMPRRRLLLITVALFIAGNAAAALAPGESTFRLARVVAGLPHGAYLALATATAAALVERDRRGRAIARVGLGQTIASIAGVPVAILIGQAVSWRVALALAVVVFAAAFVAILRYVPARSAADDPGGAIGTVLRAPGLWAGFVVAASGFAGVYCMLSFIAPITTDAAGLPAALTPLVLMVFGVGMTVGAVLGGRLADWDVARTVPLAGLVGCLVLAGFGSTVTAAWAPFAGAFGMGLVLQLLLPSLQLRVMDAAPGAPAVAAAMNQAAVNLANVIGTSVGGAVTAAGLSYTANGYAGACIAAIGVVLAVMLRPARRTPAAVSDGIAGRGADGFTGGVAGGFAQATSTTSRSRSTVPRVARSVVRSGPS
ncbi:MFS transporter [Dactylosporangium sp. CS-047395]|uniref:MFS transporter n=1 Tax=Dactylosporangium sp. CS-047395 TaxID=3239936 RepID=UPI003D8E6ECC